MRALSAPAGPQPLARRPRGRVRRRVQSTKESRRADPNRFPAHDELAKGRCRGLPRVANPRYLSRFLFPALLSVAPYCAPGGVRVVSGSSGLGVAGTIAAQIRRVKVRGGDVPYVLGMGVPPLKDVEVALLVHVALEEPIHNAYPQTRLEGFHLRLGELPYLFVVRDTLSRHLYKDLAMRAFDQVFLNHGEDPFPIRAFRFPGFRSAHAHRLPFLAALTGAAQALKPEITRFPHAATLSGCSRLSRSARASRGFSTKNVSSSIGKLTCTSAPGYRAAAMPKARGILCAWTDTSKREAPSRMRIETLTITDYFLPSSNCYSNQATT